MRGTIPWKKALRTGPAPQRLAQTQKLCHALAEQGGAGRRMGFGEFLRETARYAGPRLWGTQALALLAVCIMLFSLWEQFPSYLPGMMPLFVLACVPELLRGRTWGMEEMEAATRASTLQLMLAKLVLAGTANLMCLTLTLLCVLQMPDLPWRVAQLALYMTVPFLGSAALALCSIRTGHRRAQTACVAACAGVSLLCLSCALWLPQVYELSATGLWVLALLASGAGLGKEVYRLAAERKGSVFGGAET